MAGPDPTPDPGSTVGLMLTLGEIRGQLRELIHSSNGNSAKLDALGLRVSALENEKSRRDGAANLAQIVMKSPLIGWIVGAGLTVWAFLSGKVHG